MASRGVTVTPRNDQDLSTDDERRRRVALFRYGLVAELAQLPPNTRGLYALLEKKAEKEYEIPGTLRRHVAVETMRGWLRAYREGGFDALMPRVRSDTGTARAMPPQVIDVLCEIKDASPELSIPMTIQRARERYPSIVTDELELPLSTVHRLLARRGLTGKRRKDAGTGNDRRRFEYDEANELWMSDVMYGPKLRIEGRMRQTYLIAFIDDATRLVPHALFALSERTTAYLPALEHAIRRRGLPKRLYVDNGAAFRSHHLALACAKAGIALIHATPRSPQGKGKMERWFRTVRMQLMPNLERGAPQTLDSMNRSLAAWVEGEYHHAPHRGLGGETPADRWARISEHVKMPGADIGACFLFEAKRKVARDRTITLDGAAYELDATLVGQAVVLRYDPARPADKRTVEVWHQGKRVEIARRLDALSNCYVKRNRTRDAIEVKGSTESVPLGLSMRELAEQDELRRIF
jgi:transposase InsO family protein